MIFHFLGKIHKTFKMQFNGYNHKYFYSIYNSQSKAKRTQPSSFQFIPPSYIHSTSEAELSIKHSGAVASHLKISMSH